MTGEPRAPRSAAAALRTRLAFVALTCGLTLTGLALVGDLRLAWWVALLPLLLLIGPVTRLAVAASGARARRTSGVPPADEH